jgi:hypothetical protein
MIIATMITVPKIQSHGESAVAIRPPSRKPIGARLKRFRKNPV